MSTLFRQFQTDAQLEKKGIWVEYLDPEASDAEGEPKPAPRFLIARSGGANQSYNNAMDEAMKPYRRRMAQDAVKNSELEAVVRKVFCTHVLKGWENVADENGQLIEFSAQNAQDLFTKLPDLYEDLRSQAGKSSLYKAGDLEATAKN